MRIDKFRMKSDKKKRATFLLPFPGSNSPLDISVLTDCTVHTQKTFDFMPSQEN
jgi:hypothetical protein